MEQSNFGLFNPANLYYSSPSELPESQGQSCISFSRPMEGASPESDPLIQNAQIYLKATEHLYRDLSSSQLNPHEMTRFGKQFLNNITVANEVQDALLRTLAGKIQAAHARLDAKVGNQNDYNDPENSIPIPVATPVDLNRPAHWRPWRRLTNKVQHFIQTAFSNNPAPQHDDLPATHAYQHNVVEKLQSLDNALHSQMELPEQYETLREMEILYRSMQDSFEAMKIEQGDQWREVLQYVQSANRDDVESDEKGRTPPLVIHTGLNTAGKPSELLLQGNTDDPRTELIFLQRLKELGFNVSNVPGDDHCSLYAVFKDPEVLPVLRMFFPPQEGPEIPLNPSDLLRRDILGTRHLIAERVEQMMRSEDENIRLMKRLEVTECVKATRAYARLCEEEYPGENASKEQYNRLEACYWNEFRNGRITLSDYHLSALSTILERPILVYSTDYLPSPFVRHHLLQSPQVNAPLPQGVKPFEECYQEIPVPLQFAARMHHDHPLCLYHSHGHYQAMTPSRY